MIADKDLCEGLSEILCVLIGRLSTSIQGPVSALMGDIGVKEARERVTEGTDEASDDMHLAYFASA